MRLQFSWPLVLVLLANLLVPAHALSLLDSGASIEAKKAKGIAPAAQKRGASDAAHSEKQKIQQGSLVVPDESQVGINHGCRRSTDFFQQVCNSPLGASGGSADQGSSNLQTPSVTADLLVCDVPKIEPLLRPDSDAQTSQGAPSATYAVSGTIVVHGTDSGGVPHSAGLPEIGDSTTGSTPDKAAGPPEATYPGPDDEGFWRQRDGRHEWHPASGVITTSQGSDRDARNGDSGHPSQADVKPDRLPDAPRSSEYDAWSAEQEQGAFLSFNEWKERHAQNLPGSAKDSHSNTPRRAAPDTSTPVLSPSPNATPQRTGGNGENVHGRRDATHTHSSSTLRSTPSDINSASKGPSTTPTAPGEAASLDKDVSSEQPLGQVSHAPVRGQADTGPVGFSVAAGDTSAQLSKLKHRWNFASLDCAAVVHRTNPEAKFASSILSEKKDRYMLSPCPQSSSKLNGGSQFVIVELCEEIKIDTIVLANYEFFSNMFKKFTVTAARQLTGRGNDWTQLGVFRARNVRGQQVFRIPSAPRSEAFFRYIRIDFLEHFGSEFYCPVSLLRVYGITEMEEYKREFETHDAESDSIAEALESAQTTIDDVQLPALNPVAAVPQQEPLVREPTINLEAANLTARDEDIWRKHEQAFQRKLQNQSVPHDTAESELPEIGVPQRDYPSQPTSTRPDKAWLAQNQVEHGLNHDGTADEAGTAQCAIEDDPTLQREKGDRCALPRRQLRPFYHLESAFLQQKLPSRARLASDPNSQAKTNASSRDVPAESRPPVGSAEADADSDRARRPSAQRGHGMPLAPHGNPGSESVYRAIHRRLSALESNATLSHSYIEHSGQMLREVFARMEKRQEFRMSDMLRALNTSNWQQIESLKRRQHVDLQRAIFEFDVHRQQADTERRALLREVHILAEEVLLEKRLSIAQLVLLLVVFVFVGMTRGSRTVPLLHSGFARIGRNTKRREAKSDGKSVLPTSPRRESSRIEQSIDARHAQPSPLRTETLNQTRNEVKQESANGLDPATHQMRFVPEAATPARKHQLSSRTSGAANKATSPKVTSNQQTKSPAKLAVASLSGRSRSRGETLIGMLSHPRTRGRLVMLLETLDALDRVANLRRLPQYSVTRPGIGRRNVGKAAVKGAPAVQSEYSLLASPAAGEPRRVPRAHKPLSAIKQEHDHAGSRRLVTPVRNRTAALSGFDDLAGMSSDWTERSENGEVSENPAYMSDDDERDIRTAGTGFFSLEPTPGPRSEAWPERVQTQAPSSATTQSIAPSQAMKSADMSRSAQSEDCVVKTPQLKSHDATTISALPSITKADGRLSSSDSESEGGAWHRVLPRRIGNGSSLRRARQNTIDGKANKSDVLPRPGVKAEAPDRRGSPRPSSANGAGFKSQKAGLTRLFRSGTPDYASPESPRNRRSGTPDTIRDVKPL